LKHLEETKAEKTENMTRPYFPQKTINGAKKRTTKIMKADLFGMLSGNTSSKGLISYEKILHKSNTKTD
jgi:hypothetical protein